MGRLNVRKEHKFIEEVEYKHCNICDKWMTLDKYGKHSGLWDNLQVNCKQCRKLRREVDKEIISAQHKLHYEINSTRIKLNVKEYRIDNIDKVNKAKKIWTKNNMDKVRIIKKRYSDTHPEVVRACGRRRRAKKRNINERYIKSDEQFTRNLFNNKCFNCNSENNLHIDHHYPLSKGHPLTRNNAVLLCRSCNSIKNSKLPEDFYSEDKLKQLENILNIKKVFV